MRTLAIAVTATLLGLSSAAFAATPVETTTREARMESALKDYRAQKAGSVAQPAAKAMPAAKTPAAKKHHATRKHHGVKHAHKAHAPSVKAAASPVK